MNNDFKVDWLSTMIKINKELLDQAYSEHLYEDMCKHASLIRELNSLLSKYRLSGRRV